VNLAPEPSPHYAPLLADVYVLECRICLFEGLRERRCHRRVSPCAVGSHESGPAGAWAASFAGQAYRSMVWSFRAAELCSAWSSATGTAGSWRVLRAPASSSGAAHHASQARRS